MVSPWETTVAFYWARQKTDDAIDHLPCLHCAAKDGTVAAYYVRVCVECHWEMATPAGQPLDLGGGQLRGTAQAYTRTDDTGRQCRTALNVAAPGVPHAGAPSLSQSSQGAGSPLLADAKLDRCPTLLQPVAGPEGARTDTSIPPRHCVCAH